MDDGKRKRDDEGYDTILQIHFYILKDEHLDLIIILEKVIDE